MPRLGRGVPARPYRAPIRPRNKVQTLTDDFTSQDTAKWSGYGGNVTVVSGQLNIVCTSSYSSLTSADQFTLKDSLVSVEVPQVPNVGTGTTSAYLIYADITTGYRVHMAWQGGQLYTGYTNVGGTNNTNLTYNATAHAVWRIRESGGQTYWEASSNGTTWNIIRQAPTPIPTFSGRVYLQSGYFGTESSPGTAKFDNLDASYPDPPPAPRTFYVDNAGSNSNDGLSSGAPWQTLAKVNSTSLYPGDQILLKRGGTWSEALTISGSGTSGAPVTIGNYSSGALPIINGGGSSGTAGSRVPVSLYGSWIVLDGLQAQGSSGDDVLIQGNDCTVQNCTIKWGSVGIEQGSLAVRTLITGNTITDVNVMIIGGGSNDDSGCMGILLQGDNATVQSNTITGCYGTSPDYGVDGAAVEVYGAANAVIAYNIASECVSFAELGNPAVANTLIHHNSFRTSTSIASGVTIHGQAPFGPIYGTQVHHNTFVVTGNTTQCYGVWMSANADVDLRNNILVAPGNGRTAYIETGTGTVVEAGNVFYGPNLTLPATMSGTSTTSDPLLVSSTDLRIMNGSPAIDRGADLGYLFDLLGNALNGTAWDSGAYENQGDLVPSVSLTPAGLTLSAAALQARVTLTPAVLALTGVATTPTPGQVTTSLTAASINVSAQPVTPTPQPISVSLTPAGLGITGRSVTPTPQPVSVTLTPAGLGLAGPAVAATPGQVTVALTGATVTLAGPSVVPTPGQATLNLTPAAVTFTATALSVGGIGAVSLTPAVLSLTAVAVAGTPGQVTTTLTPAPLAFTAAAASPQPQPVTVALAPAQLLLSARQVTPQPQLVTATLTSAGLVLSAPAQSVVGSGAVALTPAVLQLTANPVAPQPQPITVALAPAAVTFSALPVAAQPQPVTVALSAAVLQVGAGLFTVSSSQVTVTLEAALLSITALVVRFGSTPRVLHPNLRLTPNGAVLFVQPNSATLHVQPNRSTLLIE